MLQQKLSNRRPSPLGGVGIVALVLLCVLAASAFFSRLSGRIGAWASAGFIAFGCAVAWFLLNWYGMSFVYTATDDCLRVCRAYGKRERFMCDVWLNRVVAWGDLEQLKQRFPDAPVSRATRDQCPFEPLALAYRDSEKTHILVIQPDQAMRAHLLGKVKGKRG